MDGKIIGAGLVGIGVIALSGLIAGKPIAKPIVGVFAATFLLSGMSAAGAPEVAGNLALLVAGTIVVIYAPDIVKEINTL